MKHFYDPESPREASRTIFSDGIGTYSTNGTVLIRTLDMLPMGHYDDQMRPIDSDVPTRNFASIIDSYTARTISDCTVRDDGVVEIVGLPVMKVDPQWLKNLTPRQVRLSSNFRALVIDLHDDTLVLVSGTPIDYFQE